MEHEELIEKHLGINTPYWIKEKVNNAINEALCIKSISRSSSINICNECSKELENGTVFCSVDCRKHYYH